MSLASVQEALQGAVIAALAGIPTEYENAVFTKPTNSKWARLWFIPNQPVPNTLGTSGEDEATGILQIDLNYPRNTGTRESIADFEEIRAAFPAGNAYTRDGQTVQALNCGRSQGRLVDNWYRVSITISWWALIPR